MSQDKAFAFHCERDAELSRDLAGEGGFRGEWDIAGASVAKTDVRSWLGGLDSSLSRQRGWGEEAEPWRWQRKWIKTDGFRTYLEDESEDFVMTGLGVGEGGHHPYHGLSLPNKEGPDSLWTLPSLGPVTLSSVEGVYPSLNSCSEWRGLECDL